ncbi:hypothetical protein DRQ33_04155 [bacterium]|nr:MAG: hypothetical protein DRQ33_04155 [bacterium]
MVKVIEINRGKDNWYFLLGLGILVLNKLRYSIFGYTKPKPFSSRQIKKAIDYDFHIVNLWNEYLRMYLGHQPEFKDKTILELGPGDNLGVGIILLSRGVKQYNAIDINNLIVRTPDEFYEELFRQLENSTQQDISSLREQLKSLENNTIAGINYVYSPEFDLSVFKDKDIDFIFSQAAFEHFDDVGKTIEQISEISKSGTILVAKIDLRTHSRYVREKDPLNIYRYPDWLYNLLKFQGSPNRVRPFEYAELLEKNDWSDITIFPLTTLPNQYISAINNKLYSRFRDKKCQMEYLSIIICARR